MIELPEAKVISEQINKTLKGKVISQVVTEYSPHKFAWFYGDSKEYHNLLSNKVIEDTKNIGGLIEISVENCAILFGDGVRIRYHNKNEKIPAKHQLLINFDDGSSVSASVQMYGGLWCFKKGENQNPYYIVAKQKPSPYSKEFNEEYFINLLDDDAKNLSAKAFLATKQRIPGLGNGVLQDILWNAKLHPKTKMKFLDENKMMELFNSVKDILSEMAEKGGRNTEKDIFGMYGGYKTVMSSSNVGMSCPVCGEIITKETYLGGSIYYCNGCQK